MIININNDWKEILRDEFKKDYFKSLCNELDEEYNNQKIFPNEDNIFNALNYTPYNDVKVVILGQDPYHEEGQANGLSFSVNPDIKIPPSLRNIYKELQNDIGCYIPNNGCLKKWANQGVLLLNTTLTVRQGEANSHKKIGWQRFTDAIISILNERDDSIIFILWGNNAISKEKLITNPDHYILKSVHPSPLSASRGFFGCKHFSKCNEILKDHNKTPIDWQINNI